ncbi:MAG: hypothetical protein Fur0019_07040 [Tibeticola sp.]
MLPMSESTAKRNIQKLQRAIVDGLEDVKAQDIRVFDTGTLSPLFERVIIASGTSNRQTKALSASVRDKVREAGFPKPRIEGEDNGEWIIVDCGAAVAHIMQPTIRSYYNLEEIWGGTPVRLKLGAAKPAQPQSAAGKANAGKTSKSTAAAKSTTGSAPSKAGKTIKTPKTAETAGSARTAAARTAPRKSPAAAAAPVSKPRKAATTTRSQEKTRNPSAKRAGVASKKVVKTVVVGQVRKSPAKPAGQAAKPTAKAASRAPARKSAAAPARKRAGQ